MMSSKKLQQKVNQRRALLNPSMSALQIQFIDQGFYELEQHPNIKTSSLEGHLKIALVGTVKDQEWAINSTGTLLSSEHTHTVPLTCLDDLLDYLVVLLA